MYDVIIQTNCYQNWLELGFLGVVFYNRLCGVCIVYNIRDISRERKKREREIERGFFSRLFVLGAHHCKL